MSVPEITHLLLKLVLRLFYCWVRLDENGKSLQERAPAWLILLHIPGLWFARQGATEPSHCQKVAKSSCIWGNHRDGHTWRARGTTSECHHSEMASSLLETRNTRLQIWPSADIHTWGQWQTQKFYMSIYSKQVQITPYCYLERENKKKKSQNCVLPSNLHSSLKIKRILLLLKDYGQKETSSDVHSPSTAFIPALLRARQHLVGRDVHPPTSHPRWQTRDRVAITKNFMTFLSGLIGNLGKTNRNRIYIHECRRAG